jgi:1,4-alpha-glucan branching enzyme
VGDLNRLYCATPALHARDCEGEGFEWLIVDEAARSVTAWLRKDGTGRQVAVVTNFTPVPRPGFALPLPCAGRWHERINTDAAIYGGSGMGNLGGVEAVARPMFGRPAQAKVTLPPLATVIFEFDSTV